MDDNLIAVVPEDYVRMDSALGRAIQLWSQGRPIPLTIAAELIEQGYDIAALERAHRR